MCYHTVKHLISVLTLPRITMLPSIFVGTLCLACAAVAQQYTAQGPPPPRPAGFTGATLVQDLPRQSIRRPVARQQQIDTPLVPEAPVRQRRPQVARSRNSIISNERSLQNIPRGSRITIGTEDTYIKPRPVALPIAQTPQPLPQTTKFLTPRPVVEDEYIEDDEEEEIGTTPQSISRSSYVGQFTPNQAAAPFQRPAFLQPAAFRPSAQLPAPQHNPFPATQPPVIIRQFPRPQQVQPLQQQQQQQQHQQARPIQTQPLISRPPPTPSPAAASSSSEEDEDDDEPQYFKQPVRQQQRRPEPSQYRPAQPSRTAQPAVQQTVRQSDVYRPHPSKASSNEKKEKKPVVQTIRKYHDENEDGSITWGYENDDGSFKEETIGVDCVTRGKYGYYDPDGVKREYSYQTGIPCDREAEAEADAAASANEGYIDYTENKYIFPNGDEIDLEAMVKNRARKPVGKYRN